jgi:Ribosomal L27 protein
LLNKRGVEVHTTYYSGLIRLARFAESLSSSSTGCLLRTVPPCSQSYSIMLQPRIYRPSQKIDNLLNSLATMLTALTLSSTKPSTVFLRHASHATQGRANGPKDTAGRRLGAKKTASQFVIPGNIIFKQRGQLQSLFSR